MLKAYSYILASGHSAARGHQWTEKVSKQSSLISSCHSFQEMAPQVKAGSEAQFWLSLMSMWWLYPANVSVSVFFIDPGCASNRSSKEWLQKNLGSFSGFATLHDLQALNAKFSGVSCGRSWSVPLTNWNVLLVVLLQLLFDFILIPFYRLNRCPHSRLLRWPSWHWAQLPRMTQN